MRSAISCLVAATVMAGALEAAAMVPSGQDAAVPTITAVRGDLYQMQADQQVTVFLVTQEGIVLADPLSLNTSRWLRAELETRFPGRPVRFVLHTHHSAERAEGASVFGETAERVAHRDFNTALRDARRESPDRYRFVRDVRSDFASRRTIALGGASVELVRTGPIPSPESTVLFFPNERTAFAVDPPAVHHAPFSFGRHDPRETLEWLHSMEELDFDVMLLGDGNRISRTDIVALADYLDALQTDVSLGYERGQTAAQIQESAAVRAFSGGPHYPARLTQVMVMHQAMRLVKLEASVAAIASYGPAGNYCSGFSFCSAGGAVPSTTASIAVQYGRFAAVVGEITLGAQSWSTRTQALYDEEVALRVARGSLLFRYGPPGAGRISFAFLGGVSRTEGHVLGQNFVRGALRPFGGRHTIESKDTKTGITAGADVAHTFRNGLSIVVPFRVTVVEGKRPAYWPSSFNAQTGVALRWRLLRKLD